MLVIVLSGIIGFLVITGIIAMIKPPSQARNPSLPAEVISHSEKYIKRLGTKPFDKLKTNQKLILIHSYYNLEDYSIVVRHAETMIDELRSLSPERKRAFTNIIEDAYRQLGQDEIIIEFRKVMGQ